MWRHFEEEQLRACHAQDELGGAGPDWQGLAQKTRNDCVDLSEVAEYRHHDGPRERDIARFEF